MPDDPVQEDMLRIASTVSVAIDHPGRMVPMEVAALAGCLGVLAVMRIHGLNEEAIWREAQKGAPQIDRTGRVSVVRDGRRIVAGRLVDGKVVGLPSQEP